MNFGVFSFKKLLFSVIAVSGTLLTIKIFISCRRKRKFRFQPVVICNNSSDWLNNEKVIVNRFKSAKIVGLDCEWVTVNEIRHPVALLQLATSDGFIVLIRLCNLQRGLIPYSLIELLADKEIIKVGVGICEDAEKLLCDYGLIVSSCLDLRHLAKDRPEFHNMNSLGLKSLCSEILNVNLRKMKSLTCSNWEASTLTPKQVVYAAEDALASAQICDELLKINRTQFSTIHYSNFLPILNIPYKQITPVNKVDCENKAIRRKLYETKKDLSKSYRTAKIMYENCQLLAPDGEQLCSCDAKKALWYVNKGRGDIVNQNPLIVKLNFEPSGRPILDNKYYTQEKNFCCVVCGETKLLVRKFVVPSEYRRHFPELMKKSLSHDVLLLCIPCHRKSNIFNDKLREQLALECKAPIGSEFSAKLKINSELVKVKSAAKALTVSGDKIPEKRQVELKEILKKYFFVEEVTDQLIKQACAVDICTENEKFIHHGLKVYEYVCKHEGLIAFESRWRKHFLDTMNPQFLPKMWSVNHNHQRLALQVLENKADFDVSILGLSPEMLKEVKSLNL